MLYGTYNNRMYTVFNSDGELIYRGGNSFYESQGYVQPKDGEPIETIKAYCESTLKEYAEELNEEYYPIVIYEKLNDMMGEEWVECFYDYIMYGFPELHYAYEQSLIF